MKTNGAHVRQAYVNARHAVPGWVAGWWALHTVVQFHHPHVGRELGRFQMMNGYVCFPREFMKRMEALCAAQRAVAEYCEQHEEEELGQFFDPANGVGSLRECWEAQLDIGSPSFGGRTELAMLRRAEQLRKRKSATT